jgi:hypothetical protein
MSEHILVLVSGGHVCVSVDDYELMDFVDDFLTEKRDIESDYQVKSIVNGRSVYTLHFPISVTLDAVSHAIQELDPDEIERIWLLNN